MNQDKKEKAPKKNERIKANAANFPRNEDPFIGSQRASLLSTFLESSSENSIRGEQKPPAESHRFQVPPKKPRRPQLPPPKRRSFALF
ncbi:MAG TPA: hypothetical protein PL182_07415, partial [Pseudobdellovibrionaceae bacterium]|nr:hypothetical protein [Pseudobdellovibrionaceae bacterium]